MTQYRLPCDICVARESLTRDCHCERCLRSNLMRMTEIASSHTTLLAMTAIWLRQKAALWYYPGTFAWSARMYSVFRREHNNELGNHELTLFRIFSIVWGVLAVAGLLTVPRVARSGDRPQHPQIIEMIPSFVPSKIRCCVWLRQKAALCNMQYNDFRRSTGVFPATHAVEHSCTADLASGRGATPPLESGPRG